MCLIREKLETCATAADRVEGFARAHAQHISENAPFYFAAALGYSELTDPVVKARVQRMRDTYEEMLRGIIRDGIESGEFRELDVKLAARAIISCLNWMARWWRPDGPTPPRRSRRNMSGLSSAAFCQTELWAAPYSLINTTFS